MQPQQAFSYDLDVLRRSARTHYFFNNLNVFAANMASEITEGKEMAYSDTWQITKYEVNYAWSQSQRIQATSIHITGRPGP